MTIGTINTRSRLLTLPAGTDCQLNIDLWGMDGPVVCHQVRVVSHSIHIKRHHWELYIYNVVMPLLVTDLGTKQRTRKSKKYFGFLRPYNKVMFSSARMSSIHCIIINLNVTYQLAVGLCVYVSFQMSIARYKT